MRLEACCTTCATQGCRTAVCLDTDPAALCDPCGEVTCDRCDHNCQETP